jgi:hypothetical protein
MTTEASMRNKIVFTVLLLLALDANAALGDGDKIDFLPIPGEFCNSDSDSKQRELFKQYPNDEGIINLYALYLGLCRLVNDGSITEQAASVHWTVQRNELIQKRRSAAKNTSGKSSE